MPRSCQPWTETYLITGSFCLGFSSSTQMLLTPGTWAELSTHLSSGASCHVDPLDRLPRGCGTVGM